ncbi:MAG: hypothetical protein WC788_07615 [Candidatus Paceibacterota bacterium]|jgi:hypothetical protein
METENRYLSQKIKIKDGLISLRGFFDGFNRCMGEVDGRKVYFFCLWFDKDLSIKKIEISNMDVKPEEEIHVAFIEIADVRLEGGSIKLLKPAKLLPISSDEYMNYTRQSRKDLYVLGKFEFGFNPFQATRYPDMSLGSQRLVTRNSVLMPDLLIDPAAWKICRLRRFFLFIKKDHPISRVVEFNRREFRFTFGE